MENNIFSRGFIGRNRITLASIPSTNDFLKDQLSKSTPFPEGTVIMAVDQFSGKGQQGAVWQSEPGKNLTFSLLLYPTGPSASQPFLLNVAIGLALTDVLESILSPMEHIHVKWPNDIFVNRKKIAGILIENSFIGTRWKLSVIGIGINVNQVHFPPEISTKLCSLKQLIHQDFDLRALLDVLCMRIEDRYLAFKSGQQTELLAAYYEKLYQFGEVHTYWIDGVPVRGKIVGVTSEGRLQLDFNGHLVDFGIKELSFTES
ncbi:MAG TPA: biotin--[acetyl-CoA-carboxylase] ligase [Sphingobacteriaceae bacterium]|nr:biotin--[acetyl-CoA-carboxylase] ligase [Sphingobacteriaceae bacterium]